jgi:enoyl-CoA hydratase/carnithine racemase
MTNPTPTPSPADAPILRETLSEPGVAVLTLNRPKALNALSDTLMDALDAALTEIEADAAVRCVVLRGAGRAFAAGADVSAMSEEGAAEMLVGGHLDRWARVRRFEKPLIAGVQGFCLGGGCELAQACDLIVASEKARFGQPEVSLGVVQGFGGNGRLARAVGVQRARELIFTGDLIDAQSALALGLVVAVLPPEQVLDRCRDIAKRIAQKGPLAIAQAKRLLRVGSDLPLDAANALEQQAFAALFGSSDQKEGMKAFLEKRPPKFESR